MEHSQKAIDREHVRAVNRLILTMEHEAGCQCCQNASRNEDAMYEAFEIVLSDWVHRAQSWRTQSYLWMVVALCTGGVFATWLAVRMWG